MIKGIKSILAWFLENRFRKYILLPIILYIIFETIGVLVGWKILPVLSAMTGGAPTEAQESVVSYYYGWVGPYTLINIFFRNLLATSYIHFFSLFGLVVSTFYGGIVDGSLVIYLSLPDLARYYITSPHYYLETAVCLFSSTRILETWISWFFPSSGFKRKSLKEHLTAYGKTLAVAMPILLLSAYLEMLKISGAFR